MTEVLDVPYLISPCHSQLSCSSHTNTSNSGHAMAVMWPYRAVLLLQAHSDSSPQGGDREGWREGLECRHDKWNRMHKGFSLFPSSTSFVSLNLAATKVKDEDQDVQKPLGNQQHRLGDQFGALEILCGVRLTKQGEKGHPVSLPSAVMGGSNNNNVISKSAG